MRVETCRIFVLAVLVIAAPCARAQTGTGMNLLAVTAQIGATPDPGPSNPDTLAAVDRILALWPELVGVLPAGEPRYNGDDIGSIASSTGANFLVRPIMERRIIAAMSANGIAMPANPTSGSPRPIDRDDNGGKPRNVTRAQLEALEQDTALVRQYMSANADKLGPQPPVNPQGLSVADWQRIRASVARAATS